ncbi:MAG TPA: hypothetical protein VEW69_03160 [Alphaproteobacteria bacterium]|nr:hypothetical protein [Alphaproteobacteria bacterium]
MKIDDPDGMRAVEDCLALINQNAQMKWRAFDLYAKSWGVNFDDMAGSVQLLNTCAAIVRLEKEKSRKPSAAELAIDQIVQNTMDHIKNPNRVHIDGAAPAGGYKDGRFDPVRGFQHARRNTESE